MATLQELENKLKEIEQEIKELKETPEDEKLYYLNKTARMGIEDYWEIEEDDDGVKKYIAIDILNDKYKYVIEIDDSDSWWFYIYQLGDNSQIPISRMFIYKYELSFEKFVGYIVEPVVTNIKLGEK